MEISGGPGWGDGFLGFTTSVSLDLGDTWSDYAIWLEGFATIVAMGSLVHIKENG